MKGVNLGLKVMKRLFAVFLVLGALMSVEAWGADNKTNSGNPVESSKKETTFVADTYNQMISLAQEVTLNLVSNSYKSVSSIFNNVISLLLATIAFFWLFKHLKNGTISREEVFKALIFVIVFVIVYVLLNSKAAFEGIASVLNIPQHLVKSALAMEDGNVAQRLNRAFYKPYALLYEIAPEILDYYWNGASGVGESILAVFVGVTTGGAMTLVYGIFIVMNLILVIAIIIIQMYATFLGGIYLIFLPLTIPLLLIPQTKGIFFACVKSYIGITMYVPLSMLPISILNSATQIFTAQDYNFLIMKIPYYTLVGIISCIIGILLLYKMPTWISELLGVANQGVGAGGALGMMKVAGMGLGAYGKVAGQNIMNAKTGKTALTRGLLNAATGGLSGVFGEGKTGLKKAAKQIKNGFQAFANHFTK